jgi:tetratricopeptide (TPR) repeat protein
MLSGKTERPLMSKSPLSALKCPLCGHKAKRTCRIKGGVEICPPCCATIRTQACAGCSHYAVSQDYQRGKYITSGKRDFIMAIKPELEDTLNKALELIDKKRFYEAQTLLDSVAATDPAYYLLDFARGVLHSKNNELDETIACMDRAIGKFPYFMEAHFNKAMAHKLKADIPNMIRSFREVLNTGDAKNENVLWARNFLRDLELSVQRTDGIDLDTYLSAYDAFERGTACMHRMDWLSAIVHFEQCSQINPRSPKGYGNIGLCKAKLGKTEEAIAALDKAIELDPGYEPAILNRASISNDDKMPDGPIPMIEYAKDYEAKNRSLIEEVLSKLKQR